MLLCHNVTKAFARGGTAITWDRDSSTPESYSDGRKLWEPKVIHKAGRLMKSYVSRYKRELPSMYYLLFSDQVLGTSDPGIGTITSSLQPGRPSMVGASWRPRRPTRADLCAKGIESGDLATPTTSGYSRSS